MAGKIAPGASGEHEFTVEEKYLASRLGSGLVDVFATAMMIAGMESAAVKTIQPFLGEGKTSVGVHVDVSHRASTPVGLQVRFKATLEEVSPSGRSFLFRVEAWDEAELIGEGFHRRVMVDKKEFERKTLENKKLSSRK